MCRKPFHNTLKLHAPSMQWVRMKERERQRESFSLERRSFMCRIACVCHVAERMNWNCLQIPLKMGSYFYIRHSYDKWFCTYQDENTRNRWKHYSFFLFEYFSFSLFKNHSISIEFATCAQCTWTRVAPTYTIEISREEMFLETQNYALFHNVFIRITTQN